MRDTNENIDSIKSEQIKPNIKDTRCAPTKKFIDGSCISLDVLIAMAEAYNEENPTNKIAIYKNLSTLNPRKCKRQLVYQFKTKLTKCQDQKCWTKQSFIKKMDKLQDELLDNTLRPDGPNGKEEWLNTDHIDSSLKQYELKYPEFKFLGAVPIDFDDLPELGIKDLNFNDLIKQNKTKIGIVFNLDEHYKSGSHWVSAYADLKEGKNYFFDSYGVRPDVRIRKFMRRINVFCTNNLKNNNTVADYNKVRHQYKEFACGTYSMNFILRCLKGDSFDDICNSKTKDDAVNKCRKVYFDNDIKV